MCNDRSFRCHIRHWKEILVMRQVMMINAFEQLYIEQSVNYYEWDGESESIDAI